ncbi:MAG: NUDIX hydrolase [Anaerolineales bacterium]
MKKVEIVSQRYLLDDFFKVEEAYLRFEKFDGTMSESMRRLNFERGDSVAVLVYNLDTQKLLLIEQFRYPTYPKGPGWVIETIAGMQDGQEPPEETARREANEETGLEVEAVERIASFYPSPGGSSERIHLYYVEISGKRRNTTKPAGSPPRMKISALSNSRWKKHCETSKMGPFRMGRPFWEFTGCKIVC